MPDDEGTCPDQDCTLENHTSGNGRRSGGSEGHERERNDMMRAVQVERQEMLSRLVPQESAHEASGIARA